MNLFDNILKSQFNNFTGQAQSQVPSFATPQAPRTSSYQAPLVWYTPQSQRTGGWSMIQQKQINTSLPMWIPQPVLPIDTSLQMKEKFWFNDKDIEFLKLAKQKGYDSKSAFDYITKKKEQEKQNINNWQEFNPISNVVWWAVSEVPNVLWNTASFFNTIWQYNPASYLGWVIWDVIKAPLSDKTFWEIRDERSQASAELSETMQSAWKTGKEFVQKYWAFDPKSTSAKVWETATDIWAALVWPNKVWVLKPWFLWTAWNLALEGWLAGAKYWVASKWEVTPTDVIWGAIANTAVWWAFKLGWKIAKSIIPKTAEEKILESVWGNITKWIVNWKKVNIPVPQEWVITKISTPLRTKDAKVLTGRALTPSYAGKTPKQMLKSVWEMTDNVKNFYSQVRTWKMKWNISTIEDAANTVINNIDSVGANIGTAIKWAKWTVWPSVWTMEEITNTLWNKIESRSGAFKPLQNFLDDTKNWLNLQDAFKAKKVYQAEITKLIKAGDAGTDSYQALVKGVQELSDNIDNVVEKSLGSKQFMEWKKQYKLLKSIASDISKSAVVEWRRSPQTFVEQLWTLQAISEWITSPLSTAKQLFAKEIWELNTRGGAWKELIKNYDKEAIKAVKNPKKTSIFNPTIISPTGIKTKILSNATNAVTQKTLWQ